jgi:hypothetical protein
MASLLTPDNLDILVKKVNSPEDIHKVISKFDPSSRDSVLFLQQLAIAGKKDLVNKYSNTFAS